MKTLLFSFTCFILALSFGSSVSAFAAIGKITAGAAEISIVLPVDTTTAVGQIQNALPAMLRAIPGIKFVDQMTEAQATRSESADGNSVTSTSQHIFNIKYVDSRILPDSLVSVSEAHKTCKKKLGDSSGDENFTDSLSFSFIAKPSTTSCDESHTFTFSAPVHTYQKFVQGMNPIDPTLLAESMGVALTVTPLDRGGSRLTLALKVQNAKYQDYFRQLRVNHLLPVDAETKEPVEPTEHELKAAFVLWADQALKTVAK